MMLTGRRLAQLRKEQNLKQRDLAEYLNVAVSTVSNYENSINSIDIATLDKLADFFEVSTDYLIGRTDERRPAEFFYRPNYSDLYVREIADTVLTLPPEARGDVLIYAKFIAQQLHNK